MKWLRAFRRSTIFVDVLLMFAAIGAILGLSMFVHFNGKKTISAPEIKSPIAQAEDAEIEEVNSPPAQTGSNDQQTPKVADNKSTPSTSATSANSASSVSPACDALRKAELKSQYDSDVLNENSSFNKAVLGLPIAGPLYKSLYDTHQANLNSLKTKFYAALAAINC